MKRTGILTLQFYRLLLLYNIVFTLLVVILVIFDTGSIDAGSFLFAKLIGFTGAVLLHYFSAKETYFYFRNAGYQIRFLIINALVSDLLICTAIITLAKLISHAIAYLKG